MLNEDKRNAVELIVEERAEARDPEDAEGDLMLMRTASYKRPKGTQVRQFQWTSRYTPQMRVN